MPYFPQVNVAVVVGIHVLHIGVAYRRAFGVGRFAVQFRHERGKLAVEKLLRLFYDVAAVYPCARHRFQLVVAAPERKTGVVPHARHVVADFGADFVHELFVGVGEAGTGEHEVLPQKYAVAVAEVAKVVVGVVRAAPHTQHIHIGALCRENEALFALACDAGSEEVGGNVVGSAREHGFAVEQKTEIFAEAVFCAVQRQGAQTYAVFEWAVRLFVRAGEQGVKWLRAEVVRPPQLG